MEFQVPSNDDCRGAGGGKGREEGGGVRGDGDCIQQGTPREATGNKDLGRGRTHKARFC